MRDDETQLPGDLAALRQEIDSIDDELLACLHRRASLVHDVAAWKRAHSQPFYVPDRERQVIERLQRASQGPFPAEAVRVVFSEIMSACLSLEERLKVAYLGPEATFTHQASRSRFGLSALYVPAATIAGVFAEVERGRADVGVVPIENSAEGVVSHTLDVFLDSDLVIGQEIVIEVSHCLLTRAGSLEEIEKVYSHPQALGQCRVWLGAHLPGRPLIEVASTALAARLAKDDPTAAAVASELAGRLYDLKVAGSKIQDASPSITRFLVIKRPEPSPPAGPPTAPSGRDKTSILFGLKEAPGALYRALAPLAEAGITLTRIESRPSRRRAWEYVFFIDVEGHVNEPALKGALERFQTQCSLVKVLGSYPSETRGDAGGKARGDVRGEE
ncbi:MAG TPA: prephenate dehydratase [Polyangia bacterium]|jgi:chorismate mutase/prephenate dehydratase|nr:prephenate dehydratase [Polyangia bacterium]